MTRQELINEVKTKVDELSAADDKVVPFDILNDKPIDTFVDGLLDECAKEVLMNAPAHHLEGEAIVGFIYPNKNGSGCVLVPNDCLRVLEFKMSEWERAVTEFAEAGSEIALKQSNVYLRGNVCKPVCVFAHNSLGRVIEYYSVKKKHEIERFVIVRVMPAEDIPLRLQSVVTWWCASRVLQIVGKGNEAGVAYDRGKSML
ncbi:MAG: hypothetical protein NC410_08945 [Oscillibacter sp.]|nr:hypothetical protein [Oscillibacter sp.]